MAKSNTKLDESLGKTKQMTLFEQVSQICEQGKSLPTTGSCNIQSQLKEAIARSMAKCSLSRFEIAGKISDLLGVEVSKYQLDSYTAESKEGHRIPAEYLVAFCRATDSYEPLKVIYEQLGLFILEGPDALRSELQKLDEEMEVLLSEKEKRLTLLQIISSQRASNEVSHA